MSETKPGLGNDENKQSAKLVRKKSKETTGDNHQYSRVLEKESSGKGVKEQYSKDKNLNFTKILINQISKKIKNMVFEMSKEC